MQSRPAGLSITELIVVLAIFGVLIALTIPIVQSTRRNAQNLHCKNNLRQLSLALEQLKGPSKKLPKSLQIPLDPGHADGWPLILMNYLNGNQEEAVYRGQPFADISELARRRPTILTCPFGSQAKNEYGIPPLHYLLALRGNSWYFSDAPRETKTPWLFGVRVDDDEFVTEFTGVDVNAGPHNGGFFRYFSNRELQFLSENEDWYIPD